MNIHFGKFFSIPRRYDQKSQPERSKKSKARPPLMYAEQLNGLENFAQLESRRQKPARKKAQ